MSSLKTRVNLHTTDGLNMSNARICFKREGGARGSGWRSAYYIKCSLLKQSLVHDKYSLPVSVNKTNVYHIMQFSDILKEKCIFKNILVNALLESEESISEFVTLSSVPFLKTVSVKLET